MIIDYYKTLGISTNASADEIKRAYRIKSKQYHPDLNQSSDAQEKLQKVQDAYDTLSNEHLRIVYDMKLKQAATTKEIEKNFHYDFSSNYPKENFYPKRRVNDVLIIALVGALIMGIAVACFLFLKGNSTSDPTNY